MNEQIVNVLIDLMDNETKKIKVLVFGLRLKTSWQEYLVGKLEMKDWKFSLNLGERVVW